MQVELATSLPYARQEGGTAAPFVNGGRAWHRFIALLLGLALLCCFCRPAAALAAFTAGWLMCRIFGWRCKRRFGGVTGDLLGACSEIVETAVLFGGAWAGKSVFYW
jgi:adenosylcobinamide-GDP ribazoletransferase